MKKTLALVFILTMLGLLFTSCEEETCKDCRIVTYENNVFVSEGTPETYCGSQLESIDGQTSIVGDMKTVMVCQ
jgi:hypothetical protein